MSKGQMLRALVMERLTAAAEDIFVLFERTIAEYEEELCRSKEEIQRQQQRLDQALSPRGLQPTAAPRLHRGPGLNQETTGVKEDPEEQSVKQEEDQLPVSVPESSAVYVKREESPQLQQRQFEHREETERGDISSEPHFHSDTSSDTDNDDDWGPSFIYSVAQMETEADGDHYNQVQTRDRSPAALNSAIYPQNETVNDGYTNQAAEGTKQECSFCLKRFTCTNLQIHMRNHTGERPYTCLMCEKTFAHRNALVDHIRIHMGEKPFSCSLCTKSFGHNSTLKTHMRVHTGEKPFCCTFCEKKFAQKSTLDKHMRVHSGEKPYGCSVCQRAFSQKSDLTTHMRIHTGEKPYRCSVCNRGFTVKSNLLKHMETHSGVKRSERFKQIHVHDASIAQDSTPS